MKLDGDETQGDGIGEVTNSIWLFRDDGEHYEVAVILKCDSAN